MEMFESQLKCRLKSQGCNWKYVNIGLCNGLIHHRHEPMMYKVNDAYVRHPASMS